MTKTLYAATSKYVEEINNLPVKRQVSVSGILKKLDVSRSGYNAWKKAKYFAIVGGGRLLKSPEHCFNPHQ